MSSCGAQWTMNIQTGDKAGDQRAPGALSLKEGHLPPVFFEIFSMKLQANLIIWWS